MPNMARDIMYKCKSVYHKVACSKLKTTLEIYEVPNITQANLNHKYQLSAISVHSVCSSVGSIYKKQILYFCKGGVQYCSVSERSRTALESGSAHMCNPAWQYKAAENIPAMCNIRYTVNSVILLDIKKYVEVIVHMFVMCVVRHLLTSVTW
jgi:hypothetical protein